MKLFADFGDVHATDFKSWWKERGVDLFAEPPKNMHFSVVQAPLTAEDLTNPNVLYLQVPLDLPATTLRQRFDALLKKHHEGRQGVRLARSSQAKYPVIGQPNVNALMVTLKVYDHRQLHPEKTLWQIGMILDQFKSFDPSQREGRLDGTHEKNIMAATVSRYLRKAEAMIHNVGLGRFPDTTDAS